MGLGIVEAAEELAEEIEFGAFVIGWGVAERWRDGDPSGGELGIVLGERGGDCGEGGESGGGGGGSFIEGGFRGGGGGGESGGGGGEGLGGFEEFLAGRQSGEAFHFEASGDHGDLEGAGLDFVALEI